MELEIVNQLTIPHRIIENIDYCWENVWAEIKNYLNEIN